MKRLLLLIVVWTLLVITGTLVSANGAQATSTLDDPIAQLKIQL